MCVCIPVETANSVNELDSKLHTGDEKSDELEDKTKEITQNITQRNKYLENMKIKLRDMNNRMRVFKNQNLRMRKYREQRRSNIK